MFRGIKRRGKSSRQDRILSRGAFQPAYTQTSRPIVEPLEERVLLTAFNVTNTNDSGTGSLRQAILSADATGGTNIINFSSGRMGQIVMGTISLASQLPAISCNLTVNGSGQSFLTVNGDGHGSVFTINSGVVAEISGLKITGGNAAGTRGGGIFNQGILTVNACNIRYNTATAAGGIYNSENGDLTVTNTTLFKNTTGPSASAGVDDDGGGIESFGTLTLSNCNVTGNTANNAYTGDGGGIANNGVLTISNSTINGNTATGMEGEGGGIFSFGFGSVTIEYSTVSGNSSPYGGGIGSLDAALNVIDSTISGNTCTNKGGGIDSYGSDMFIANSTISGNTAGTSGGGIAGDHCDLQLYDSTISGNQAGTGGGLYLAQTYDTATFKFANLNGTIDAGNTGGDIAHANTRYPELFGSYDLIGDGSNTAGFTNTLAGTTAKPLNPMLSALGSFGGPTQTMELQSGSPAIGAGLFLDVQDANGDDTTATDQRGVGRPFSGDDIGAFQTGPLLVNTLFDPATQAIGYSSLRNDITIAEQLGGTQTIAFLSNLTGTIALASPLPALSSNVDLDANPGPNQIVVNGGGFGSVFTINTGVTVQIDNLTISGGGNAVYGGGIDSKGTLTLINSTISGNSAADGGGVYGGGMTTVANCTITGNTANGVAGGVNVGDGIFAIADSTISGNQASAGAGLFVYEDITSCTVNGCIIAGNTGGDIANQVGGNFSGSFDLIGDGSDNGSLTTSQRGTAGSPLNPDLLALADNAGPTDTMALLSGSAAVGHGANFPVFDAFGNDVTIFDQRGFPRSAGQGPDIGAFQSGPLAVNILTDPATETFGQLSLRQAINVANTFDIPQAITFAAGLTGTINLDSGLPGIAANITVDGPGQSVISVRGGGFGTIFTVDSFRTVTIENLTITDGDSFGNFLGIGDAGGITNFGTLTLANCTISSNTGQYGGGVYNAGVLALNNSTLRGNTVKATTLAFGGGGIGGGIFTTGGTLTVINSTITGDIADDAGGSTVIGGKGGGICGYYSAISVTDSTISGNAAQTNGGGIYAIHGTLTVDGCTISENTSNGAGGGVCDGANPTTVVNSTITGNSAQIGGAVSSYSPSLVVTDSTITGNSGAVCGGMYLLRMSSGGTFTVSGTIVAANPGEDLFLQNAPVLTGSNDLIGDGSDGGVLTDSLRGTVANPLNPQVGTLAFNGGLTQTMALLPGSPALGAGANFPVLDSNSNDITATDQRGMPRPQNGLFDIGAYEFQRTGFVVTTLADPATQTAGTLSLRQAIADAESFGGAQTITFIAGLSGTISVATSLPSISTNITIDGPGVVNVSAQNAGGLVAIDSGQTLTIENFTITGGGVIVDSGAQLQWAANAGTSTLSALTIQTGGKLDIANNKLLINYGTNSDPVSSLQSALTSGFNGGAWNGSGIISSTVAGLNSSTSLKYAVGFIDGATPPLNSVSPVSSGTIEILPTLAGDAQLSGTVSFYDFQLVLSNFGKPSQSWDAGDFDFSSTVDFYDFQAVLSNFGQNSSALAQFAAKPAADSQQPVSLALAADSSMQRPLLFADQPLYAPGVDEDMLGGNVQVILQL